jgi:hypothetical protein
VNEFLHQYLEFDPSVHVRAAASGAAVDIPFAEGAVPAVADRLLQQHVEPEDRSTLQQIRRDAHVRSAVACLLRCPEIPEYVFATPERLTAFRRYLLPVSEVHEALVHQPPQDTYHRWAYYTEVNYEELRTVTEALYPERPDLDWMLALWEVFEGTPAEVDEQFAKYCQKHQDDMPSTIRLLEFGGWSFLADFKDNRRNIEFYNKNTDVLKRILDRHVEDKKIGADLMRNRVRQAKARNIATDGPDAVGLSDYRHTAGGAKGANIDRVIAPEEMLRLERARGDVKAARELEQMDQLEARIRSLLERQTACLAAGGALPADEAQALVMAQDALRVAHEMAAVPADAVQIDMFTHDPASGEFSKSHFYTQADDVSA